MTSKLIARERECSLLRNALDSDESEFVTICGRRRIGKTFLVEQFFEGEYDFKYVGGHSKRTREQLRAFSRSLHKYSGQPMLNFVDWFEAFDALEDYLTTIGQTRKIVVFIDEMPWMDTKRSQFVTALESFWNGWAVGRQNVVLIATGSATSWMKDKLLKNRGGLYNRIRTQIYIRPFTLQETENYLKSRSIEWDRYQILQAYMFTGGVPYYLKMIDRKLSLAQNIDALCFNTNGPLKHEFEELFNAVFPGADTYIEVAKALGSNREGLTRKEILAKSKVEGAFLSKVLNNLERSNFIEKTSLFGNRKTEAIYRLTDFFTLFHFKFIESNDDKDENWWSYHLDSRSISSWMGLTFELICMLHHPQIKKVLGISGIATSVSAWRCFPDTEAGTPGAQIDLIIERADRLIHFCELKFSQDKYNITNGYENRLRERMWLFKLKTKTKLSIVHTFVTTFGLGEGKHHSIVHSEVTMDDLFRDIQLIESEHALPSARHCYI